MFQLERAGGQCFTNISCLYYTRNDSGIQTPTAWNVKCFSDIYLTVSHISDVGLIAFIELDLSPILVDMAYVALLLQVRMKSAD